MGTTPPRIRTGAALLAAALAGGLLPLLAPTPASADTAVITTAALTFQPADITISEGDSLELVNVDGPIPHDVTSVEPGLFASATIDATGSPAGVDGVEELAPGAYAFYCTIHPDTMTGTLTVVGAGEPDDAVVPGQVPDTPSASGPVSLGHLVPTPTAITVSGTDLYAASWSTGTIFRAPILEGGLLGVAESYATGFTNPLGVVVDESTGITYVADSHPSSRDDRTTAGRVSAIAPGGGDLATAGQVLVDELPNGRHNTNNLAVHQGRLHITNGNSTDDGVDDATPEEPLSGTLLSIPVLTEVDPAADPIVVDPADGLSVPGLTVEATGMRNDYDVAFRPGTDEAWITTNGPDQQDPWGEDLLHVAEIDDEEVEDFGFPECLYSSTAEPSPNDNSNPAVGPCGEHVPPVALLGLHVSANGLAFGPPGTAWEGHVYIARFGNFFGNEVVGHDVIRLAVDGEGNVGPVETFLPGITPLDLTFGPDGLYVADFTGAILLVPSPSIA